MKKFFIIWCISLCAVALGIQIKAEETVQTTQTELAQSNQTTQALSSLSGASQIPLEKYDTTAVVEIPNMSPSQDKKAGAFAPVTQEQAPEGSPDFTAEETTLPKVQDPQAAALQTPEENALTPSSPVEEPLFGLKMNKDDEGDDLSKIPPGTLAVYINIEEAFNKNPWTIEARKTLRLELETKQLEYAQMTQQITDLKDKLSALRAELAFYTPFYSEIEYVPPTEDRTFPRIKQDTMEQITDALLFCTCAEQIDSPKNSPQNLAHINAQIRDVKKVIIDKEATLLNFKELSKEEVNSRQDYIVGQILKEIYSGIKEYSSIRNIGMVVDKKDLVFGKPLNVTDEFIKWMKKYHKKYQKQLGEKQ